MKNIHFIFALCCLSLASAYSQSGKLNFSAGVGFEPTTLMDKATVNTMPMTFKMGYQFTPLFSLSAFGGYTSSTSKPNIVNDGLAITTTTAQTFLGLRGELKKEMGKRFEVYGGAAFGYILQDITEKSTNGALYVRDKNAASPINPNAPKGQILYAGFVGTNFYIQKHIGLFAELGYGVSLLNAGVTVRF